MFTQFICFACVDIRSLICDFPNQNTIMQHKRVVQIPHMADPHGLQNSSTPEIIGKYPRIERVET